MISDHSASGHEIAAAELPGHFTRGVGESAKREQAREREGLDKQPGESEATGEHCHGHGRRTRETGDAESERGAAREERHRRAVAQTGPACREEPAEPRDGMVAVGWIAESQIDRESQEQNERPRDFGAQDLGNESPTSLARAPRSTARATASARCSYRSPAGVPHRGSAAIPFRAASDLKNARRSESFAKRP